MKKIFTKFLMSKGAKLCAVAVTIAGVAPICCRANWYQPKEPKGLEAFLAEHKSK